MNDHVELFVGVPGSWRDDVESRVAANPDPFVRFMWEHFAWFSALVNRQLPKEGHYGFLYRVLFTAYKRFDDPLTVAAREAFPLEWFQFCIMEARLK